MSEDMVRSLVSVVTDLQSQAATQGFSQSTKAKATPLDSDFEKAVTLALNKRHVAGLSVAVIDGNETFSEGYGVATFPDEKVTPSTLFYGASTTKSFTAAAASLLIDDTADTSEPLSWKTTLSSLMKEDFVMVDEWTSNHLTLEDALCHRTGLGRHEFSYGGRNNTLRDTVRSFRHLPLTYEIRTQWRYNNLMYAAVAHAIELHTQSSLGDFLARRIWKPLNMSSTFFSLKDAQAASATRNLSLATPYTWVNKTQEFHKIPWFDDHSINGAHGVISNVLEYTKWLRCHINEAPPLSFVGHEELHYPRMTLSVAGVLEPVNYALGWMRVNYRGEPIYFHQGSLSGFAALMAYLPGKKWGVAMMSNTGGLLVDTVLHSLSYVLLDDYLQTPSDERIDFYAVPEKIAEASAEVMSNPKEAAYLDAPRGGKAIPLSLPLEAYVGNYTHPAYQNLTVVLKDTPPYLSADPAQPAQSLQAALQRTFPRVLDFQHVSGEFFVVYIAEAHTYEADQGGSDLDLHMLSKAEFRIGENGTVKEMGIMLEAEMGEEKIWFRRV